MVIKKSLRNRATSNTRVTTKKGRDDEKVIKEGKPLDTSVKYNKDKAEAGHNPRTAGVSIGMTKNMDNFESLRIDTWLTDEVQENETHTEAMERLKDIALEALITTLDATLSELE